MKRLLFSIVTICLWSGIAIADTDWCYEYVERGEYDKAIKECTDSIKQGGGTSVPFIKYNNRGRAYASKREYDKAVADYSKSIELNPKYSDAYYNRGNAYAIKKEYDKALADYSKSIELDPNHESAYLNRGIYLVEFKNYWNNAIQDWLKVIELNPESRDAYYNLSCAYSIGHDIEKACSYLEKAVSLGYDNPDLIKKDSDLDNIRNSACYKRIISGI